MFLSNSILPTTPLILFILITLFPTQTIQQPNLTPTPVSYYCLKTAGNYTSNSPYQLNLKTLLTSLETASSSSSFFQTTIAESSSDNSVYGRYLCRHDLSLQTCSSCIHSAAKEIVSDCPNSKEAIVYFEQCTLFYLNNSSRLDLLDLASPYTVWYNKVENVTDPDSFFPVLQDTLNRVINESAYGPGLDGFGTEEGRLPKFETLYSLAECSPDRVGLLCERCLRKALTHVDSCCRNYASMAFFYPNCQLRYSALGQFYDVGITPPAGASPSPPVSTHSDPGQPTPGNWAIARMSSNVLYLAVFMALPTLMLLGN